MSAYTPLFPLNLVVFPDETLKLYIFEPRYKELIQDCLEKKLSFCIPTVIDKENMAKVVTEVRVASLDNRYPNGEMNITTQGQRRAKLLEFDPTAPDKLYPGGAIEWLEDDAQGDLALQEDVYILLEQLNQALGITRRFAENPQAIQTFSIAHHIGLNLSQKVELLGINSEIERLVFAKKHLEEILPIVKETESLKAKAKLNGHYKNVIPPDF